MDKKKRTALEAAGFRIGDAWDFLELTPEERRLVELRVSISRAIRRLRQEQNLTQQQLADRLKSSQSRIAKVEVGASDVSLDLLFRGLFALGGKLTDLTHAKTARSSSTRKALGTKKFVKAVKRQIKSPFKKIQVKVPPRPQGTNDVPALGHSQ